MLGDRVVVERGRDLMGERESEVSERGAGKSSE